MRIEDQLTKIIIHSIVKASSVSTHNIVRRRVDSEDVDNEED